MRGRGDDRSVDRRFSAAADTYDDHARVQREVADALMAMAPDLSERPRILEAGCGTGYLTVRLADRYPSAAIDAFDSSARMVETARGRLDARAQVRFHTASFEGYQADNPYDLAISSSALHWVQSLAKSVQSLADLLRPGGRLLAAIMVEGTLGELLASRVRVVPDKAPRVQLPASGAVREMFSGSTWEQTTLEARSFVEHYPSAHALLSGLHAMGLTGGSPERHARPLVRGELECLERDYEARYRDATLGVRATYEVLFVDTRARTS